MTSLLGKASSVWTPRLSLVGPGWRSSAVWPILAALGPELSSFVRPSLDALRSSFSEELVMVAMIPLSLLSRVEVGLWLGGPGLLPGGLSPAVVHGAGLGTGLDRGLLMGLEGVPLGLMLGPH